MESNSASGETTGKKSPIIRFRRHSSPALSPRESSISDTTTESHSSSTSTKDTDPKRSSSIPSLWSPYPFATKESQSNSQLEENKPQKHSSSSGSTIWTPDKEYIFPPPPFQIPSDAEDPFDYKWDYNKYEFRVESNSEEYPASAPFPTTEYQASSASTDTSSSVHNEIAAENPLEILASILSRNVEHPSTSADKKTHTNFPRYEMGSKIPVQYSTSGGTTTESQSSHVSRETNTAPSITKSMSIDYEIDSGPSSEIEPSPKDIIDALPRRSLCTRLRKQKRPWLEHIKSHSSGYLIAASLQVLSFIFVMLRCFSPIGDPISFTITAGCLFAISFTFFRAIVPEGPSFLASPIADETDEVYIQLMRKPSLNTTGTQATM